MHPLPPNHNTDLQFISVTIANKGSEALGDFTNILCKMRGGHLLTRRLSLGPGHINTITFSSLAYIHVFFSSLHPLPSLVHSSFLPLFVSVSLLIFLCSLIFISSFFVCLFHSSFVRYLFCGGLFKQNLHSNSDSIILNYTLSSRRLTRNLTNTTFLFLFCLI